MIAEKTTDPEQMLKEANKIKFHHNINSRLQIVILPSLGHGYQRFRVTSCLHLQG